MKRLILSTIVTVVSLLGCGDSPTVEQEDGRNGQDADRGPVTPPDGGLSTDPQQIGEEDRCIPESCDDLGLDCGPIADGCGGLIECGDCDDDEACGIVAFNVCTSLSEVCDPIDREVACEDIECGRVGDGCGGTIACGTCDRGEICGIEASGRCDEPPPCEPLSPQEACAERCGVVANGCDDVDGGLIDCSDYEEFVCPAGTACGAGGEPNVCGSAVDTCAPLTQNEACDGLACGLVSDGCNSGYLCGSCTSGSRCSAGACEPLPCTPKSPAAACAGKECGLTFDGCGTAAANTYDCSELGGGCLPDELCGVREAFQCNLPYPDDCTAASSCQELGWSCGIAFDECGNLLDCGAEGRVCTSIETCMGGIDGPTECLDAIALSGGGPCSVCGAIPRTCAANSPTRMTGRVITPGRNDDDTPNQIGVPNAFVYLLRNDDVSTLPAMASGIPDGGTSCDRCDEQDLGPILVTTTTNAQGEFTLQGNIPVEQEFVLVVKAGKFRRAVRHTLDADAACSQTPLPSSLTRLPRSMTDGLAVNIPRIAISTGQIDAIECVFEKMGIAHGEFTNGSALTTDARIHLYRGGPDGIQGARVGTGVGTPDSQLYGSLQRLQSYDMLVADCEGGGWDGNSTPNFAQRDQHGARLREYLNRGGRMFASHLSFSWMIPRSGDADSNLSYAAGSFERTGLSPAAAWASNLINQANTGIGLIATDRPRSSPRIQNFSAWLRSEGVTTAPAYDSFSIAEPRSQIDTTAVGFTSGLGSFTEEFVYRDASSGEPVNERNDRTQQFSFNTPYGAPDGAQCGRVVYSGFHVAAGGANVGDNATFPGLCGAAFTNQEKVLLYMLFDLGACVGKEPEAPVCTRAACGPTSCGTVPDGCGGTMECPCPCVQTTCQAEGVDCGPIADGCGGVLDCGPCACVGATKCPAGVECGVHDDGCGNPLDCGDCPAPLACFSGGCSTGCPPLSCGELDAECGWIGDGCGASVNCGECPQGQVCRNNACIGCQPHTCDDLDAECGVIGNGCGGTVNCGECPAGEICGAQEAFRCGPPPACVPRTCEQAGAECGLLGDGCSASLDCGECPPNDICGLLRANRCDRAGAAR